MADLTIAARNSKANQIEMFRRAKVEEGLDIPSLMDNYPFKESTLREWSNGTAAMPAWALGALGKAGIPDQLLSLVLEPFHHHVGKDETGEGDLDTAGLDAGDAQHAIQRARHPASPGGVAIVPQERAEIIPLLRKSVASGRRAVG
jgi:hypothetical protein